MNKSPVVFVRSTYESINNDLEKAIRLAGHLKISDGDSVLVKINLCAARLPQSGTITHPLFLNALLRYLRTNFSGLKLSVIESDATSAQPDLFIRWFGFEEVLRKWDAHYVNLSKEKTYSKTINDQFFRQMKIPEIFQNSFFITLPKLKTNLASGITCCLKNQFGCLPEVRKVKYHKHLDAVIADSNLAMKPDFCLVDAMPSMGGHLGPGLGTPIPVNAIICGFDPVAVDTFCAKLVGFRPWQVGHIRKAASVGLGSMKYELVGDNAPPIDFETSKFKIRVFKFGSWLQSKKTKKS
jgi:uncharacterized protein (DUF362 family)